MKTITLRPQNRRRLPRNFARSPEEREYRRSECARMNKEGMTDAEIGLALGIDRGTVSYYLGQPSARRSA